MPKNPKTIVEEGYDQVAEVYSRLEGDTEWPRMKWLEKILARLEPGREVLDLAVDQATPRT